MKAPIIRCLSSKESRKEERSPRSEGSHNTRRCTQNLTLRAPVPGPSPVPTHLLSPLETSPGSFCRCTWKGPRCSPSSSSPYPTAAERRQSWVKEEPPPPTHPPFPPGQLRRFLHPPLYSTATEITPRQLRTSAERGERLPGTPCGGAAPSSPPSCPRRHRRHRHPRRRSPFHLPPPEVTSPPG